MSRTITVSNIKSQSDLGLFPNQVCSPSIPLRPLSYLINHMHFPSLGFPLFPSHKVWKQQSLSPVESLCQEAGPRTWTWGLNYLHWLSSISSCVLKILVPVWDLPQQCVVYSGFPYTLLKYPPLTLNGGWNPPMDSEIPTWFLLTNLA